MTHNWDQGKACSFPFLWEYSFACQANYKLMGRGDFWQWRFYVPLDHVPEPLRAVDWVVILQVVFWDIQVPDNFWAGDRVTQTASIAALQKSIYRLYISRCIFQDCISPRVFTQRSFSGFYEAFMRFMVRLDIYIMSLFTLHTWGGGLVNTKREEQQDCASCTRPYLKFCMTSGAGFLEDIGFH